MLHMLKIRIPNEAGNAALSDPEFGKKMNQLLTRIKAKSAYFSTMDGQRGGYVIVDVKNASDIPGIAEPFFLWLKADVSFEPVMRLEDLAKAGKSIGAAVRKYG